MGELGSRVEPRFGQMESTIASKMFSSGAAAAAGAVFGLHGAAVGRAKREGGEVRDRGRSQRSLALNSCGDAPADPAQNRPDRVGRGRRIEPLKAMRIGDGRAAPRNSGGLEPGIGERAKIGRDRSAVAGSAAQPAELHQVSKCKKSDHIGPPGGPWISRLSPFAPSSPPLRVAQNRQLSEVLGTCQSNGRHSRF
jgi:hypothetical protein